MSDGRHLLDKDQSIKEGKEQCRFDDSHCDNCGGSSGLRRKGGGSGVRRIAGSGVFLFPSSISGWNGK